jgi:hypothetical protein
MFRIRNGLAAVLALFVLLPPVWCDDQKPAEEKLACPDGLTLTVRMQGPYDADVPLQVVCYFTLKAGGATLKGAPVELDKRLGGVIGNLRDRGEFVGDELETLVLDTGGKIPAKQLLLVGIGDQQSLSLERMERVGRVAYREAARLGAARVAFAPLIRDQGNDRLPTGEVARLVVRGLLLARDTDVRLQKEGLSKKFAMDEWVEEAGPDFYRETIAGMQTGIEEAKSAIGKRKASPFVNTGK